MGMPERIWADTDTWYDKQVYGETPYIRADLAVLATTHQRTLEALERLVTAVANMRVPQNQAEAALQVTVTIGPALTEAQAVLARIKEATLNATQETAMAADTKTPTIEDIAEIVSASHFDGDFAWQECTEEVMFAGWGSQLVLGRFGDRIAPCYQGEDGEIIAFSDNGSRVMEHPDQVLIRKSAT